MKETMSRLRRRVVLLPLPFQGHINPMLQLGSILYSKGFSIAVVHTRYNAPNSANYPHFTFHSMDVDLLESEESAVISNFVGVLSSLNTRCQEPLRDCLSEMTSMPFSSEEPIACLIVDQLWYFCSAVAKSFNLPFLMLRTSSLVSSVAFNIVQMLLEKGYLPIQDHMLEQDLPDLSPLKFKDHPATQWKNFDDRVRLHTILFAELKASNGLIFNSFHDLEIENVPFAPQYEALTHGPTFLLGPFHKCSPAPPSSLWVEDKSSITWLDRQPHNSVLYVSFGSLAKLSKADFTEVAWALANNNQPFLWVVRSGLVSGSSDPLPNGFLEAVSGRGYVVKWAPQLEVLAHPAVGGFWTHSGWNSTLESVCEGVPMICLPSFADQMVNARCVSEVWNIGMRLENGLERGELYKVIRTLMVEAEGEKMRERARHFKEKANLCLAEGGSSYKSLENLVSVVSSP